MNRFKKYLIAIVIILAVPSFSFANQWEIDKAHANVSFKVKHVFSLVAGHFTDFDGDFFFNPDDLENAKFNFQVNVKSINTFNSKRDTHLKSKDFFEADKFPQMMFKSTKVTHKKDNIYDLEGELTIKDVTKLIVVEFMFYGPKDAPFDKKKLVAGFDTNFTIDRLQYHVGEGKFFKMGVVGQFVEINLSLEALAKK